jgi:hypothetical protein
LAGLDDIRIKLAGLWIDPYLFHRLPHQAQRSVDSAVGELEASTDARDLPQTALFVPRFFSLVSGSLVELLLAVEISAVGRGGPRDIHRCRESVVVVSD